MNKSYRILKLKTGEEIITRITKRDKGKVSIETPMIFRTIIMSDPYTGMQKEVTILKDWVLYSSDSFIKIPEEEILCYASPLEEAISLYEKEKLRKKNNNGSKEIKNFDSVRKDMQNDFQKFMDDMINQAKMMSSDDERSLADIFNSINAMGPGEEFEVEWEFMFPAEEISDETTETETNHPDYGNRWTDWSSDPKEY